MQGHSPQNIRNIVLLSHSGAGKTSLSEAVLFSTGAINRWGKVDEGTTTSDYEPEEIKRKISIKLSLLPISWKGSKINFIDTPGYLDFVGEVKAGVRVCTGAVVVVCAASGVEVGTEQVWGYAEESRLPRVVLINKMDRENANFQKAVEGVNTRLGKKCVVLEVPVGAEKGFQGIVDLVEMKSYLGSPPAEGGIPDSIKDQVQAYREKLVEALAELDDALLSKYLEGEQISQQELQSRLAQAVKDGKLVPILVGSALQGKGIASLLDAISYYLPSAAEAGPFEATNIAAKQQDRIEPRPDAPLAALVFKTTADPYVGRLTYFRVFSGTVNANSQIWNAIKGNMERIGQLFVPRGKSQETVSQLVAGDIGAVTKLSVTSTGDTLSSKEHPLVVAPPQFPTPIFSMAVYPKGKADVDKMGTALPRLAEEDPTLRISRDTSTGETIISGRGDVHIEAAVEKMQRKFGTEVVLSVPKVPYRETIRATTTAEYKHKKQTGGHGQYGHVLLELEPLARGSGFEFAEKVVGGSVPKNYFPAVEKGVVEAVQEGILAGYPVIDVKISLYDGSFHPVDSSEISFKIAALQAVKKGLAQGTPVLLEPIMNMKVTVPDSLTGDIISDLNTRRARVLGMNPEDGTNVIEAKVPLAEVLRYAIDMKSLTQGRGTFVLELDHYEEVPEHITQQIVARRQAEKAAEKS